MEQALDSKQPPKPLLYDLAGPAVPKEARLFLLAQAIATRTPDFFAIKGAGAGDKASNVFMAQLRKAAADLFEFDFSEKRVCREARFALDFYFTDEATAVEVALSLRNSSSEYERDIFKCLLARDEGCKVTQLVFITKPGGHRRCKQRPGAPAIERYLSRTHGLEIEIRELNDGWADARAAIESLARGQLMRSREEKELPLNAGRLCSIVSTVLAQPIL